MSSKEKKDVVVSEKVSSKLSFPTLVKPQLPPSVPFIQRKGRTYTFEQWATRRGIPSRHKGGLRAYVANVKKARTLEEWDATYKDY